LLIPLFGNVGKRHLDEPVDYSELTFFPGGERCGYWV